MTKIELGPVGAVLSPGAEGTAEAAVELERLGYSTIWLTGGPLTGLDQLAEIVRATRTARVASGIISVDRFAAKAVDQLYLELEAEHPGRFVVGLGGAHGARPLQTTARYLDELESVPVDRRVLAALGPRMLELARARTAAAFPVLVTLEYTAQARAALGADVTLAVEQLAVVETDAQRARTIARGLLGFFSTVPPYRASFRRMGFTDAEIAAADDRLVDALVPWGDAGEVARHVRAQQAAGADHVAVSLADDPADVVPLDGYAQVAAALRG